MSAYATIADMTTYGVPSAALAAVPSATQQACVDAANDYADSILSSRYRLPLTNWGKALTRAVAILAAFDCISSRGYNPQSKVDQVLKQRADEAKEWFEAIANGHINPTVSAAGVDSTKADPGVLVMHATVDQTNGSGNFVTTSSAPTPRGW